MSKIAKAYNVSPATIYIYFKDNGGFNKLYLKTDELSQYINKKVLFVAAGTIQTLEQAELVIENREFPAIGYAFLTDSLWMQKQEMVNRIIFI